MCVSAGRAGGKDGGACGDGVVTKVLWFVEWQYRRAHVAVLEKIVRDVGEVVREGGGDGGWKMMSMMSMMNINTYAVQ